MKSINLKKILLFLFTFIIFFCFTYFFIDVTGDEIWNYAFGYNIASGSVPYRDFNMIITPLYSYLVSTFIKIFGYRLWSLHILNSVVMVSTYFIFYKLLKNKSFIILPLLLCYCYPGYNSFCLFLTVLIIYFLESNKRYDEMFITLLASLLFLTKQTVGMCLFIPMIYYSKNKLKSLIVFLIPIFLFFIYLIWNGALYNFIDYCFLGMFDFGTSNGIYFFLIFEIPVIIYSLIRLLKSKFMDKKLFYILMFQVITVPICDDYHFMIGFMLFLYYLLDTFKMKKGNLKYYLVMSLFYFFMYIFSNNYFSLYFINDVDSFMFGRKFDENLEISLNEISNFVNECEDRYDNVFVFSQAYLIKLNIGLKLNKFDLINNGNMGYDGANKYINEIDLMCSDADSCLFILDYYSVNNTNYSQLNYDILEYVMSNYDKQDNDYGYLIYSNSKF